MSSMKDWAVEKLSVFLGFDPETLEEQVYPYLMSLDTFNELVEHLTVSYSATYSRTIR
jgi:Holliday junction resolvasome RuvABC ATP-dependent DNA helicase subunit